MKQGDTKAPGKSPGALSAADPESDDFGGPAGLIGPARWMVWLERAAGILPAVILLAMMALTFVNVFMRYLFRQPISGAFELMSYMLGLMVFLSLVLVAARSEHVRISVLDGFLPDWFRRVRAVVVNLILAGNFGRAGLPAVAFRRATGKLGREDADVRAFQPACWPRSWRFRR
jgi:hypothetical protein